MTTPIIKRSISTQWWNGLEDQWKRAFNEAVWRKGAVLEEPSTEELELLTDSPALRFAGPRAPYPNMTFELNNLSGISALKQAETLVVTHHALRSVQEVAQLKQLKNLFINNNLITDLQGIQALHQLEMLYAQCNALTTILPIRKLTKLREVYLNDNQLNSLEGLREEHSKSMKMLMVLPNENLPDREVMRVEREIGIRCQGAR